MKVIIATVLLFVCAVIGFADDEGWWYGFVKDSGGNPVGNNFKYLYIYHVQSGGDDFSYNYQPGASSYQTQSFANGQEYGIYACVKISGTYYYSNAYYETFWGFQIRQDLQCTRTSPPPLKEGEPDE